MQVAEQVYTTVHNGHTANTQDEVINWFNEDLMKSDTPAVSIDWYLPLPTEIYPSPFICVTMTRDNEIVL